MRGGVRFGFGARAPHQHLQSGARPDANRSRQAILDALALAGTNSAPTQNLRLGRPQRREVLSSPRTRPRTGRPDHLIAVEAPNASLRVACARAPRWSAARSDKRCAPTRRRTRRPTRRPSRRPAARGPPRRVARRRPLRLQGLLHRDDHALELADAAPPRVPVVDVHIIDGQPRALRSSSPSPPRRLLSPSSFSRSSRRAGPSSPARRGP